jgi:hypothetical protein
MSELQAVTLEPVPETRPVGVASDVEDDRGWQGRLVDRSEESQGRAGGIICGTNATGWLMASGSSKEKLIGSNMHAFKFSLHEGASQSSRHSSTTKGTGSKGTGSKNSGGIGGGRAHARKRRQRIARAKENKVDMDEWNRRVVTIKDFWDNLCKNVSLTRLGTSLLDTVETDDTLEPLFRCISA